MGERITIRRLADRPILRWIGLQRLATHCDPPVFRLVGNRYVVRRTGVELLALMDELLETGETATSTNWMLPFRDSIRQFDVHNQHAWLTYIAVTTQDAGQRRLAIWLRGRCGGTLGTQAIHGIYHSVPPATQRTLVHALRRMHAWSLLDDIAKFTPDSRIRRIATPKQQAELETRLPRFLKNVDDKKLTPRPTSSSKSEFVAAEGIEFDGGKPPKPIWMIRQILNRIQWLVRGTNQPRLERS